MPDSALSIGDVADGIRNSNIAGRDIIQFSIQLSQRLGIESRSALNLGQLHKGLLELARRSPENERARLDLAAEQIATTIAELPTYEEDFLERVMRRYGPDSPYFVDQTLQTMDTGNQPDDARAMRRIRRRAVAEYSEWIPAQREILKVRIPNLESAVAKYGSIVLLGEPGSGKTTALEMLTLRAAQLQRDGLQTPKRILPLLVRLSELRPEMTVEELLVEAWGGSVEGDHWGFAALGANLEGYLDDGRLMVVFDALNEMPSARYSSKTGALRSFIDRWRQNGNQFIVSCRELDYGEELQGLQRVEVLPLTDDQIASFVLAEIAHQDRSCGEIWDQVAHASSQAEYDRHLGHLATEMSGCGLLSTLTLLLDTINGPTREPNNGLAAMARNPYLLTVIIDLFLSNELNPGSRAELIRRFVHTQFEWARGKTPEQEWISAAAQTMSLAQLGYELQRRAQFGTLAAVEHVRSVMPTSVQTDPAWPPIDTPPDRILRLATSARILEMPVDRSTVRFYHQMLQDFFVATEIVASEVGELREFWRAPMTDEEMPAVGVRADYEPLPAPPQTGWEEATILATDLMDGRAGTLVEHVLEVNPVLAGRMILESSASFGSKVIDAAISELLSTVDDLSVNLRYRVTAGGVLGRLGDPRIGSLCPVGGDGGLVKDASGTVVSGFLPGFHVGAFPVTNCEYQAFLDAAGYNDPTWWTSDGWEFIRAATGPLDWAGAGLTAPNWPVVGVSFHEAHAYCCWRSAETGTDVHLPTEAQWQRAAGGADGGRFPWGEHFDPALLNSGLADEPVNWATPIGLFPGGASPYGIMDCAGQVWEWTCTMATDEFTLAPMDWSGRWDDRVGSRPTRGRVLRGGSWSDLDEGVFECAHREWFYPEFRSSDRGFRIAVEE